MGVKITRAVRQGDNVLLVVQKEGHGVHTTLTPIGEATNICLPLKDIDINYREMQPGMGYYRAMVYDGRTRGSVGIHRGVAEKIRLWQRESLGMVVPSETPIITEKFINAIMSLKIDED